MAQCSGEKHQSMCFPTSKVSQYKPEASPLHFTGSLGHEVTGLAVSLHRKEEKGLMTPPENRTSTKIKEILYFLFSDRKIHWQRPAHSRGSCKGGSTPLVETSMQIPILNLAF